MADVNIFVGDCHGSPHNLLEIIEMKLSDLALQLGVIDARLTEASAEIVAKLAELQAALADADVPESTVELVNAIADKASALADIVVTEEPVE